MSLLKSKSEIESMKRIERIAKKGKKYIDKLTDFALKPDHLKKTIYELGQDPQGLRIRFRQYPNMKSKI